MAAQPCKTADQQILYDTLAEQTEQHILILGEPEYVLQKLGKEASVLKRKKLNE